MKEQIIKDITEKVMIKLAKHEVELQIEQISDLKNQAGSLYKEMTSKGEQYKKEYYSKTAALEKPFNQLRAKIYTQSQDFLTKTKELGIDGKSTTPYKEMVKLIDSMDKQSEYFNKEYVKQ